MYSTMAMFWPFTARVWILLLSSTTAAICFLFIVTKFLLHFRLESPSIKLDTQVLLILASYVEQDSPIMPVSQTVRSFIALWSFFTLIVTTLYRSKLVTLLAFPVLGKVPKTFEELAFSDFKVGFMKNGDSAYSTFSRSKDPVYVELVKRMEVMKGVNLECLEKVVNEQRYACIAYDFDVKYLQQKNFSDVNARKLKYSNARTYNVWLGLATEAHSIFMVNFGKVLGQTTPFHLAEVWSKMDMYANVRKPKLEWWKAANLTGMSFNDNDAQIGLTFSNIQGVFYVFLYCNIVSILALLYECCSLTLLQTQLR